MQECRKKKKHEAKKVAMRKRKANDALERKFGRVRMRINMTKESSILLLFYFFIGMSERSYFQVWVFCWSIAIFLLVLLHMILHKSLYLSLLQTVTLLYMLIGHFFLIFWLCYVGAIKNGSCHWCMDLVLSIILIITRVL